LLARASRSERRAEAVLAMIWDLDRADDVRPLLDAWAGMVGQDRA
jgi:hypothetical protein